MKFSVRGNLAAADSSAVVELVNKYQLWRLVTGSYVDEDEREVFTFEVWLNSESDKDSLFNGLKPYVVSESEYIDWHECTHDEPESRPCVIEETYRRY